jgi:hypothetical protein
MVGGVGGEVRRREFYRRPDRRAPLAAPSPGTNVVQVRAFPTPDGSG